MTTQAPKTPFEAKKWLLLAIFGQKCVFLVIAAPIPLIICSKTLQNTFLRVQHPENRVWGPTTDHSGAKSAVLGYKMAFFGPFWAKKGGFSLVMAASKPSPSTRDTFHQFEITRKRDRITLINIIVFKSANIAVWGLFWHPPGHNLE